jgi:hypothetical protein
MKKLFLTLFGFALFSLSLNAANYPNSKCPQWEQGDIVYYNGVQQNVAGTAPSAFCWDATKISGLVVVGESYYDNVYENLTSIQSLYNWFSSINNTYYVYGEYYYGVYITVVVMGYPQNEPTVKIGSTIGTLIQTTNIYSPIDTILNGKEYRFFVRKIPVSQAVYMSDIDVEGYLEVYDGATLKDSTYIH